MPEIDMYNPTKQQEIEDQKMKIFNRDTINVSDKIYILKTNKGVEIVDLREDLNTLDSDDKKTSDYDNIPLNVIHNVTSHIHNDSHNNPLKDTDNKINSSDHLNSEEHQQLKTHKNPFIDQNIIDALNNFIGDKSIKRMKDRLLSDLPPKEASFLIK